MANEEHLARLRAGVEVWNRWRRENPGVVPDLRRADLSRADLSQADLSWADLSQANLMGANLTVAKLMRADLFRANLFRAELFRADLFRTKLIGADLSQANLSEAKLIGADFSRANLNKAVLSRARFSRAVFGSTIMGAVDLRNVHGLDTVQHVGPSTIGLDTIERSQGQIPESFLRGCGVSDRLIEYIPSLTMQPIQYYSCFISYSSHDEALAERLYADLQAKGVRCWFAPHDLKIGESILGGIDQGIRLHEKVLLLLSESSIGSTWVQTEINLALHREHTERRRVLFPVRLDDAVLTSRATWATLVRTDHHIGDFCGWQDYPTYQAAFARLLRDLKATPDR